MSNINRIRGSPNAIVLRSTTDRITGFNPPLLIDASPLNTTITGHKGNEYPGTFLPSNRHIRLVEFYSEHVGKTRSVFLRYHSVLLRKAPEFTALSYTWGPTTGPSPIEGIYITDNLLSALANLAECEPQLFWIDALCINQLDLDEKPEQIKMMREIYQKAKNVCVWLGDPDPVSISLLKRIGRSMTKLLRQMYIGMKYTNGMLRSLELPEFEDPAWISLMEFLARPYFRRIWVLQELMMASDSPQVACGRVRFPWFLIQTVTGWLRETNLSTIFASQLYRTSQQQRPPLTVDLINISLDLESRREPLYLEHLIGVSKWLDATEPRDKIIALLGLVSEEDECLSGIEIDYRKPVIDFYRDVTGTIMKTHNSLKLLSLVTDNSSEKIQGLPSWVPDYSIDKERPAYRWAHFLTPGRPVSLDWEPGSNELHVWGHFTDEVQFVAEDAASLGADTEDVLLSWFRAAVRHKSGDEWKWILSLGSKDGNIDSDAEQFWRTMLYDVIDGQSPAPEEFREHFASIVFHSYLQGKAGDDEWFIRLGTDLIWNLQEVITSNDIDFKRDDMIRLLIQLAMAANREGRKTELPDWSVPKHWLAPDEDNEYTLGPRGDGLTFIRQFVSWGTGRFFITKEGRMGKGPLHLQVGDRIVVVNGTDQVFLLRNAAANENYRLVGECYVHGLMRSEERWDTEYERIILV